MMILNNRTAAFAQALAALTFHVFEGAGRYYVATAESEIKHLHSLGYFHSYDPGTIYARCHCGRLLDIDQGHVFFHLVDLTTTCPDGRAAWPADTKLRGLPPVPSQPAATTVNTPPRIPAKKGGSR